MATDDDAFDALSAAAELDAALTRAPSDLESELVILRARVADLERGLAAADARADRAEAEVSRAGERLAREAQRELTAQVGKVLLDFIAVLDDLDRAIDAARRAGDDSALLQGIELSRRRFLAVLATHGVTPIAAAGARFDPALHEAVSVVAARRPEEHDRVAAVVREGYLRGGELLRAAVVVVARAR